MAGFGLVGAGGAMGGQNALEDMIKQRLEAEAVKRQVAQQQFSNSMQTRQANMQAANQKSLEQDRTDRLAETARNNKVGGALRLAPLLKPGQSVTPGDAQNFQEAGMGSLIKPTLPQVASTQYRGTANAPGLRTGPSAPVGTPSQISSPAQAAGQVFTGTQTQDDTAAKEAEAERYHSLQNDVAQARAEAAANKQPTPHFTVQQSYDADGKPNGLVKVNTLTGEVGPAGGGAGTQLKPPPKGQPIPATTQDALAGLNVADVEGVKVLRALKSSGLDQSNDPFDPRWQKFMVTTMKMSPADFNKADIQQRVAMVNAVLTRGLMGGRPSQYVAEMVQQHMPQGEMSGQQLTHVLTNVLQQAGERRQETAHLFGRKLEDISPTSGENYAQYLQSQAPPAPAGWKYVPKQGGGWTAVEDAAGAK